MPYELRKIENSKVKCPFCGGRVVKNTVRTSGKQGYKCVNEKRCFTLGVNYVTSANS